MKLYVECKNTGERIYLSSRNIVSRGDLPYEFQIACPVCGNNEIFTNREVHAEPSDIDSTSGAIIGGLIGILTGLGGALIGAGIGGIIGAREREQDLRNVRRFNRS